MIFYNFNPNRYICMRMCVCACGCLSEKEWKMLLVASVGVERV